MAMNLLAAGHELRVYNRDRLKTLPFKEKGVHVCESPAEAAEGAAFVVSIVADDDATRDVMLGGQGVLSAAAKGAIVIDSSTNTPAMAKEVAAAAADEGIAYLDAPVSGSIAQAQGKELVFLVGGDKTAFEKAQPVMAAMGKMARRIGGPGAGATVKLINNMLGATLTAAIGEAAMAVEAADLDRDAVIEVLNEGAAGSRLTRAKLPKIFKRDFAPQFQLELMEKDLRYYLALAQALDRPSPIASLIRSQYQAARRAQLGKLDSCAVFLQAAGEKPKG
jgi:3-hydroxyisobutyrate dehydrogenase